jgi:hypothetical protein
MTAKANIDALNEIIMEKIKMASKLKIVTQHFFILPTMDLADFNM